MWNYSNTSAETTLTASVLSSATSITVDSTAGLPVSFPYSLVIDYGQSTAEVVTVTGLTGSTLTVTRGQDGTAAQSHSLGAVVVHGVVARDVREPQQHIEATSGVHGIGAGSVVGTTTTQTLTNKTINGAANTLSSVPSAALVGSLINATVQGSAASSVPLTVTGAVSQTNDLTRWQNSAGVAKTRVNAAGELVVDQIRTDGSMDLEGAALVTGSVTIQNPTSINSVVAGRVTGDTVNRYTVNAAGRTEWGPGGAAARDVTLYRSAANVLRTDDALSVGGTLAVGSNTTIGGTLTVNSQNVLDAIDALKPRVCRGTITPPGGVLPASITAMPVGSLFSTGSFTLSAGEIVVPVAGSYLVCFELQMDPGTVGHYVQIRITLDGVVVAGTQQSWSVTQFVDIMGSEIIPTVAAGQKIGMSAQSSGANRTVGSGSIALARVGTAF